MAPRIGAYVLTGDPVWLRSSLSRYYDHLNDLVVLIPEDGVGWAGRPIPVQECLDAVGALDTRGIARAVRGRWTSPHAPLTAETAQRQAGVDALSGVDWILQVDNDELLPDVSSLLGTLAAQGPDVVAVEWPMRVLYRSLGAGRWAAVVSAQGLPVVEYPGPVAVRAGTLLGQARRPAQGRVLRMVVRGDDRSLQVRRPAEPDELRDDSLTLDDAIWHNSWGRTTGEVWRKTRTWGHAAGWRGARYFVLRWLPSRWLWRWTKNFHFFADGLWPALRPVTVPPGLLRAEDHADDG